MKVTIARSASVGLLLIASCSKPHPGNSDEVGEAPVAQALISDQAHGGRRGFFWLPPMVKSPVLEGSFDGSFSPRVEIHEIDSSQRVVRHVATFTSASAGPERVRVESDHYQVNWNTGDFKLETNRAYRIKVAVEGGELGSADVWLLANGSGKRDVDAGKFIPLVRGQTLPIKFFLNRCGAVFCAAADQCHDPGICDLATGTCSNPAKADGSACSDGNACTQSDSCRVGDCVGSDPVFCSASDECHEPGVCDPASGVCSNPEKADGSACSDGNSCTQIDSCQSGVCQGASEVTCLAMDECHAPGVCDPGTGTCSHPPSPDGTACSDSNACTRTDSCVGGVCQGTNPVVCTAADQCHSAGVCDPARGTCSNPPKADGTACSDGNLCTQTDVCLAGSCSGANPVVCAPQSCGAAATCDPGTGTCDGASSAPPASSEPRCGNGTIEYGRPTSIEFAWLARKCNSTATLTFRINNTVALQTTAAATCGCLPGIRTRTFTSASVLGLLRSGDNAFSVSYADGLAWASARVVGSTTKEVVIFDAGGGGDAEARIPDMCLAGFETGGPNAGLRSVTAYLGEECDDCNSASGDGCSSSCQQEICGNGRVDINEQCDDGNIVSWDGCSGACKQEYCGDGILCTAPMPTALTFSWAASGCHTQGQPQVQLTVNGRPVLTSPLLAGCSCEMTVQQLTTTDPALLSAFSPTAGNSIRFELTGTAGSSAASYLGWAAIRLSGVPVSDIVIFDAGRTGDASAGRGSLCVSGENELAFGNAFRLLNAAPWGAEQCDDGNSVSGDGCSATCKME
jgi:cysteine-rich repeat protein